EGVHVNVRSRDDPLLKQPSSTAVPPVLSPLITPPPAGIGVGIGQRSDVPQSSTHAAPPLHTICSPVVALPGQLTSVLHVWPPSAGSTHSSFAAQTAVGPHCAVFAGRAQCASIWHVPPLGVNGAGPLSFSCSAVFVTTVSKSYFASQKLPAPWSCTRTGNERIGIAGRIIAEPLPFTWSFAFSTRPGLSTTFETPVGVRSLSA